MLLLRPNLRVSDAGAGVFTTRNLRQEIVPLCGCLACKTLGIKGSVRRATDALPLRVPLSALLMRKFGRSSILRYFFLITQFVYVYFFLSTNLQRANKRR